MMVGISYSDIIPDHRFASSSHYNVIYIPSNARLMANTAWAPSSTSSAWLQIDLGPVMFVCAVATQGSATDAHGQQYAKSYKLRVSLDNANWNYYQENNFHKVWIGKGCIPVSNIHK